MPMVGMSNSEVIIAARSLGNSSKTIENAPASSTALASWITRFWSSPLPCTLYPPNACNDCGVKPTCPMTGMSALTIASMMCRDLIPPSNLTACARPSCMSRAAFLNASGRLV